MVTILEVNSVLSREYTKIINKGQPGILCLQGFSPERTIGKRTFRQILAHNTLGEDFLFDVILFLEKFF